MDIPLAYRQEPPTPDACPRCNADLWRGQDPESCDCRYHECVSCRRRVHEDEIDGIGRCEECHAEDAKKCPKCGYWRVAAEFGKENCLDCEWQP